jgi:hypothetical protein
VLYEYSSFLVDIVGNVWALPDGADQVVFDGLIDRIWPLPDDQRTVVLGGTRPFDTAPGGFRPSMVQLDTTAVPYGDLVALQDNHCFIPTVSSLDLATTDLFHDVAGDPDILALTPFDAVYFPLVNELHNIVTPENAEWLRSEVLGTVTAVAGPAGPTPPAPVAFRVHPNPFNPRAQITFTLDRVRRLEIAVYDLAGRRVARLAEGVYDRGDHRVVWDGRDARGRVVSSGTYSVRVADGTAVQFQKATLLR